MNKHRNTLDSTAEKKDGKREGLDDIVDAACDPQPHTVECQLIGGEIPQSISKDVTVFIKWFVLKLKNGPSWLSSLGVICK